MPCIHRLAWIASINDRIALHDAARSGRHESVDILLASEARPTAKETEGINPLDAYIEYSGGMNLWNTLNKRRNH